MSDLDRRISGDWIDIRESAADFYSLNDYFKVPVARMLEERTALGLANEEGITEYKRSRLGPVFTALENMLYKSLTQGELERQLDTMHILLFITMLQRCVILGSVNLVRSQDDASSPEVELDLKMVLGDIQERVKADPSLQKHPAVKNILAQIKRYQSEMAKMKELSPKIKGDARKTFLANFRETFVSIAESIKKNHAELIKAERAATPPEEPSIVRRVPLKSLGPVITQQATTFARMKSTLVHAVGDKFRTREILAGIFHQKAQVLGLLDAELNAYAVLCRDHVGDGSPRAAVLFSKTFGRELGQVLERQARVDTT